jgi:hypothetical protein
VDFVRPGNMIIKEFQSSPGLATGCDGPLQVGVFVIVEQFQSSPGLATGCDDDHAPRAHRHDEVSILTRPCDRVRRR